ncbi:hypothetical protein C1646_783865 [Rhizophagus diaphanus]|nr:hypothetical protein C1646_783865 [Rhizophagus diaphanus] [Rhizophagus sp. MUCL 43196]
MMDEDILKKRYTYTMEEENILKKRYTFTMEEENDIFRQWITRDKTFCNDEQEMYICFAKLKKLTVFDHFTEKYIVFDTLDTYWEMLGNTHKEYQCFKEVVFNDVPQSPVIEINLSSNSRYPGTKIVEILRTTLDAILQNFRTHFTDYTNISPVPSTLDDLIVMDKIVHKNGTWHYFFYIQTTSFYFPSYYHCTDFCERVCASLPDHICSLVTRPTEYTFQLASITGSYLLSFDNNKRITPFSQFLGTRTSVNRNDLFVSRYSAMHDPTAYAPLHLMRTEQQSLLSQSFPDELCWYSQGSNKDGTDFLKHIPSDRVGDIHSVDPPNAVIAVIEETIPSDSSCAIVAEQGRLMKTLWITLLYTLSIPERASV